MSQPQNSQSGMQIEHEVNQTSNSNQSSHPRMPVHGGISGVLSSSVENSLPHYNFGTEVNANSQTKQQQSQQQRSNGYPYMNRNHSGNNQCNPLNNPQLLNPNHQMPLPGYGYPYMQNLFPCPLPRNHQIGERQRYQEIIRNLRSQNETLKLQKQNHETQKKLLKSAHELEIQRIQLKYKQQISTNRFDYQQKTSQLKTHYEEKLMEMKRENEEIKKLKQPLQSIQPNLKQNSSKMFHQNLYKFSQLNKSYNIKLTNNNLTATNKNEVGSDYYSFSIIEGTVLKEGSQIQLKIQSVCWAVYLGLCIKSVLTRERNIGPGCFIIGCGGDSLCHSNEKDNNKLKDFMFEQGDVVKVKTSGKNLVFINQTKKKEFSMAINLTEQEWRDTFFCVQLHGNGDSVSIMDQ